MSLQIIGVLVFRSLLFYSSACACVSIYLTLPIALSPGWSAALRGAAASDGTSRLAPALGLQQARSAPKRPRQGCMRFAALAAPASAGQPGSARPSPDPLQQQRPPPLAAESYSPQSRPLTDLCASHQTVRQRYI